MRKTDPTKYSQRKLIAAEFRYLGRSESNMTDVHGEAAKLIRDLIVSIRTKRDERILRARALVSQGGEHRQQRQDEEEKEEENDNSDEGEREGEDEDEDEDEEPLIRRRHAGVLQQVQRVQESQLDLVTQGRQAEKVQQQQQPDQEPNQQQEEGQEQEQEQEQ
ncbi:hypothetical protein BGZ75_002260, partial [Mortierella antarctica]